MGHEHNVSNMKKISHGVLVLFGEGHLNFVFCQNMVKQIAMCMQEFATPLSSVYLGFKITFIKCVGQHVLACKAFEVVALSFL